MRISIAAVGKLGKDFFREAAGEYEKRLSRFAKVEIWELGEGPDPRSEGERILKRLPEGAYVLALAIDGTPMDSLEFAGMIEELALSGKSHLVFLIGGSDGLSREVLDRADRRISFSKMTFPHQLMRVILLEQIYRAMKIIRHEPYHK
ncbi:MAG: 23S rRNA (pseudouridine(1915)-N(3))-methyltransferase RlmH [Lachnospiraceae bacterium]|nr:23S rRNA (pseudouridine(1915)-N(3))-methyltransferase RlmH [Lachnospiraceae bacterium]